VAPGKLYINARNMNKGAKGAPHPRFEAHSSDGAPRRHRCLSLVEL
jgi:hypothetical protein